MREKQSEQRKKQNEIREKLKEEVAKRDQMKKGNHQLYAYVYYHLLTYLVGIEIDLLYDKRREIIADFRKQQEEYLAITREQRDAERTQRQEKAKRKEEERQSRQRERSVWLLL